MKIDTGFSRRLGHGLSVLCLCSLAAACGGGGGSDDDGEGGPGPAAKTGVLTDAAVAGVAFQSQPSGLSGTTNAAGEFSYAEGDTVSFRVGGIVVGSAAGQAVVTPTTLADAIANLPDGVSVEDVALNLAIFLQSFDSDGDPDNGITIAPAVATAAADKSVNFVQASSQFPADAGLTALATATGATLVTAQEAQEHLDSQALLRAAGSWYRNDPDGGDGMETLSFFADGRYVFGSTVEDLDLCEDAYSIEYGRFSIDGITGALRTSELTVDTASDDCPGLHLDPQDQELEDVRVQIEPDRLVYSFDAQGEPCADAEETLPGGRCGGVFQRVPGSGSSLAGSWMLDAPDTDAPIILNLLDDDRFFFVEVNSSGLGIEYGTWSVNQNGVPSVVFELDTDEETGLSSIDATRVLVTAAGRLEIVTVDEGSFFADRLPLAAAAD